MVARILNAVLLFLIGAVTAAVGTIAHQSTWKIAGFTVPWGLILGLLAIALLLSGLRLVVVSRWPALAAALGAVVMIGLFSLRSTGGSVLIPDNSLGKVWVVAPVIVAAIVIAWPRISRRRGDIGDSEAVAAGVN